jgi:hypothetical protein
MRTTSRQSSSAFWDLSCSGSSPARISSPASVSYAFALSVCNNSSIGGRQQSSHIRCLSDELSRQIDYEMILIDISCASSIDMAATNGVAPKRNPARGASKHYLPSKFQISQRMLFEVFRFKCVLVHSRDGVAGVIVSAAGSLK